MVPAVALARQAIPRSIPQELSVARSVDISIHSLPGHGDYPLSAAAEAGGGILITTTFGQDSARTASSCVGSRYTAF